MTGKKGKHFVDQLLSCWHPMKKNYTTTLLRADYLGFPLCVCLAYLYLTKQHAKGLSDQLTCVYSYSVVKRAINFGYARRDG